MQILKIGEIVKTGIASTDEEKMAWVIGAAATTIMPYVIGYLQDLTEKLPDKAITFADHVMEKNYRFKAGPIILEPADASAR